MLSTYGIMLVKFNLITFLFQPLCIFNTHFTLHFKHFDYILLVRLAWFCRSHRGREKTRRYVELFFVFFWQLTRRLHFIYEPRWMRYQPEILCDFANNMSTRNVSAPALSIRWGVGNMCALPAFRVVHLLPLGVGTRPPGEPCERQEPSTMVWWELKWARPCAKFAEYCLRLTSAPASEWLGLLTSRQKLKMASGFLKVLGISRCLIKHPSSPRHPHLHQKIVLRTGSVCEMVGNTPKKEGSGWF